jgi:hypothetical protein
MGHRNADRISIVELRPHVETVEAMIRAGWSVRAACPACRLELPIDLWLIASTRGAETSLWDRDARCRRPRCKGRMRFEAKARGLPDFQWLAGRPPAREPAWLRGRAASEDPCPPDRAEPEEPSSS